MAKIAFDVKFRPQIESGEYKVETRDGKPARIVCWDRVSEDGSSIVALVNDGICELGYSFKNTGRYWISCEDELDLFIITPEPELAESEDERIRKRIINILGSNTDAHEEGWAIYADEIAWLEKQKEQKPVECITYAEMEKGLDELTKFKQFASALSDMYNIIPSHSSLRPKDIDWNNFCAGLLTYLEEHRPAEWSEDYQEEDLRTRFAFYTYKDEDDVLYLSNVFVEETSRNKGFGTKILAAAEKVAETLGAISIRLKVKQNSPANAWYRKNGYGYLTFEGDYDWLENRVKFLRTQSKQIEAEKKPSKRLPTIDEWKWLISNCRWKWDGKRKGRVVTAPNGNSIFLPAAGYQYGANLYYIGFYGFYWSSSLSIDDSKHAYGVYFNSDCAGWKSHCCCSGHSVRLVSDAPIEGFVDIGNGLYWAEKNEEGLYTYDKAMKTYSK